MAKNSRKALWFDISHPDDIEDVVEFANRKAGGLRVSFEYTHNSGMKFSISGPKDRINLFEHQLRDFVTALLEETADSD